MLLLISPTCALPVNLARAAGLAVQLPPPGALPRRNISGDTAQLAGWR